jgi:LDH2 family malate/lactate/ureidoglycolate dehydrogenase
VCRLNVIGADALERWTAAILEAAGARPQAARDTARCLVDASSRGLDSHGVVFLHFYLPRLRAGTTDGAAEPEVVVDAPALAIVDGHDGLGAHVGTFAMSLCCDRASTTGAAVVLVRRSSHYGAASYYAELAAARSMIGVSLSNSDPGMAPVGTLGPLLGTNPLAIAAPAPDGTVPPTLDIATSEVAQGKVILHQRAGKPIPEGWGIGPDGAPTTDADAALAGAVLPFAGHKGFGLSYMLDVICGSAAGALTSPHIPGDPADPRPQRLGHAFIAIDVTACDDGYDASLRDLADQVHAAPRGAGYDGLLVPGEPELRRRAERAAGIPLDEPTLALLRGLADEYGVPFPEASRSAFDGASSCHEP